MTRRSVSQKVTCQARGSGLDGEDRRGAAGQQGVRDAAAEQAPQRGRRAAGRRRRGRSCRTRRARRARRPARPWSTRVSTDTVAGTSSRAAASVLLHLALEVAPQHLARERQRARAEAGPDGRLADDAGDRQQRVLADGDLDRPLAAPSRRRASRRRPAGRAGSSAARGLGDRDTDDIGEHWDHLSGEERRCYLHSATQNRLFSRRSLSGTVWVPSMTSAAIASTLPPALTHWPGYLLDVHRRARDRAVRARGRARTASAASTPPCWS